MRERNHRQVPLTRDTVLGPAGQPIQVRHSRDTPPPADSRAAQAMTQVQAMAHRILPTKAVWIPESLGSAESGDWAPDGTRILFDYFEQGQSDLRILDRAAAKIETLPNSQQLEQALHENRLSHRQMVWNFHPPPLRSRRPNSPLLRILRDELPALRILHSRSLAHPQAACAISDHARISRERVAWH